MKINKNLKLNSLVLWQMFTVVFLLVFVILVIAGVLSFNKTEQLLLSEVEETEFKPFEMDTVLLEKTILILDKKEADFKNIKINKPYIQDPSL